MQLNIRHAAKYDILQCLSRKYSVWVVEKLSSQQSFITIKYSEMAGHASYAKIFYNRILTANFLRSVRSHNFPGEFAFKTNNNLIYDFV
jgi:hypothetical protein